MKTNLDREIRTPLEASLFITELSLNGELHWDAEKQTLKPPDGAPKMKFFKLEGDLFDIEGYDPKELIKMLHGVKKAEYSRYGQNTGLAAKEFSELKAKVDRAADSFLKFVSEGRQPCREHYLSTVPESEKGIAEEAFQDMLRGYKGAGLSFVLNWFLEDILEGLYDSGDIVLCEDLIASYHSDVMSNLKKLI